MRRVVITGMGINSCLGNDLDTVSSALREGRSGITALPDHAEAGLRSQVGGAVALDLDSLIDRKLKRFMGDASLTPIWPCAMRSPMPVWTPSTSAACVPV